MLHGRSQAQRIHTYNSTDIKLKNNRQSYLVLEVKSVAPLERALLEVDSRGAFGFIIWVLVPQVCL